MQHKPNPKNRQILRNTQNHAKFDRKCLQNRRGPHTASAPEGGVAAKIHFLPRKLHRLEQI